jgi:hypothetical protein
MKNNWIKRCSSNGTLNIVAIWAFFEIIWYLYLGVHFDQEARKYIDEAQHVLQNHTLSEARYVFYFSTIAVIAFASVMHTGVYGALFIILAINLLAYLYFFKALKHLFKDRLSAYIVITGLLSFWPYQTWSLYLYTECLFYSILLIFFSHLILFKNLSFKFLAGLSCYFSCL